MASGEHRLLLLDGHSLAYRAFYALPVENFSTGAGQPTNAVYGFTSMLINALRDEDPTHVAVAFDVSRTTFRSEAYPEYKATRAATPAEFRGQVDLIRDVLTAMGVRWIEVEGYEADDVIATLATQADSAGVETCIITGDRDAFQLVSPRVTVLYPRKGVSDLARMTPEAVEEKYGLTPAQYPDFAALRGDPSDNLPGIPGVGEKTATKWLHEYGSLAGLVDHVDTVKGKVGEALRASLPQVLVNRQLTELVRDVSLDLALDDLERRPIEREPVHEVFDALQFRVLRDRLFDTLATEVAPAAPAPDADVEQVPEGGWPAWLDRHAGSLTGVAVQGHWGAGTGDVDALALSSPDGSLAVCPLPALGPTDSTAVAAWLGDPERGKVLHDAKGPLLGLWAAGLELRGLADDTAVAAYLVQPGQRSPDLADLSERYLGRSLGAAASGQLALGGDEGEDLARAAAAVREVSAVLTADIAQRGATALLHDVELPLVRVLAEMERVGIAVDLPGLQRLSVEFADEARAAESEAHRIVGRPFNLGSPKQLQEILFGERGLPKTKRIKTGYTTDAEALQSLFARTQDPVLECILRWRDWSRLRQTVDGLIPLAADDGRIHTTFQQTVTATGRLSSTDPNLQNIPIRTEAGRRIRQCFVVGAGYECLLTADYSQIEMRIMAHLSQDTGLIAAFAEGEDLHTTVASRVFGVDATSVDAEMRRRIKAMSYGLAYGLSAYGLAQQLGIEPDEAKVLMDDYFARFGGIRDYLQGVVADARERGFTETILGRRRYLPDLMSDNRQRRDMAERMALNAPIQGSAADIIKVAMLSVTRDLAVEGMRSRLLLQVHDELVVEVAPGERERAQEILINGMAGAADLRVPLDVSIGSGKTWEAAGH
ncbi:MAG: DNA polymerase I [Candidatus Nanopelagicales bacterium]